MLQSCRDYHCKSVLLGLRLQYGASTVAPFSQAQRPKHRLLRKEETSCGGHNFSITDKTSRTGDIAASSKDGHDHPSAARLVNGSEPWMVLFLDYF